ncbi:hypothetical protein [Portibacter marinus]|uniref:hypothetical protein n=1 Tax=Portibacter marinus TaxID=2898660 RepID=UPI001F1BB27F|nr:hypothetical protein [Portibacter marinus]
MKTICKIALLLIFSLCQAIAQFETTVNLYDTIDQGPYIEPENDGYNFLFKTKEQGTMVSTRGQVINPALDYHVFNHYYLNEDGNMDSLFSITIKEEVTTPYTMYKRGLPKLIQYRVGTSNDPSLDKIISKYPIISSVRNNDEYHEISHISFKNGQYEFLTENYDKGKVSKKSHTNNFNPTSEHGTWVLMHQYAAANIDLPLTLLAHGRKIDDKSLKFNEHKEYRFVALDKKGEVLRDEEITFEKAYDIHTSGIINKKDGSEAGFYIAMLESGGKANEDQNTSAQKILFFDHKGIYEGETEIILPFEPKSKEMADQKVDKVLDLDNVKMVYLHTSGNKKNKVSEGYYTYQVDNGSSQMIRFKEKAYTEVAQDLRNKYEDRPEASTDYKYATSLENGNILCIASENGVDFQFLHFSSKGELLKTSTAYMLTDIGSKKNIISFEYLNNNKLLIKSKVGYENGVYTSYGIYDGQSGYLKNIQPSQDIATIHTYRNGDDIMVFGSSWEDEKKIHLILHKLDIKKESLSSIGQD